MCTMVALAFFSASVCSSGFDDRGNVYLVSPFSNHVLPSDAIMFLQAMLCPLPPERFV